MPDKNQKRLDRQFQQLETHVPHPLARTLMWLRRPYARLIRIPLGILFLIGGLFSFLPVLGVWMLPLGLLLLAIDIPLLRGPVGRSIVRTRRWRENWLRRRDKQGRSESD